MLLELKEPDISLSGCVVDYIREGAMKKYIVTLVLGFVISMGVSAADGDQSETSANKDVVWTAGVNIDEFWLEYANSKGGLTWGRSATYPEYEKVKEGDTFLVEVKQGSCLMEFFHNRWRRANDVRRWNPSVNEHSGCPYVFD